MSDDSPDYLALYHVIPVILLRDEKLVSAVDKAAATV